MYVSVGNNDIHGIIGLNCNFNVGLTIFDDVSLILEFDDKSKTVGFCILTKLSK